MEINKLSIFKINDKNNDNNTQVKRFGVSCPNLAPLKQDTISFKGAVLKKTDFKGTDFAVIEIYKINPQQLKSKEDLQTFAENKIKQLKAKDFGGRQEETRIQRKAMLKEWFDYVIKENDAYSNTQRLIILSAVTKDLKPNNDTIPPVLNKGVLAQTITELEEKLKTNPKENFDFNKMYQNNLRTSFMKDSSTGETMTGWIIIPSKENDPENFEKNVEKLKILSHNNWCTKSFNAEPYLSEGDFHVYLENGQPKLGVRFVGEEVQEIQGEKNNGKVSTKYLDIFTQYQKEYSIRLDALAKSQLKKNQIITNESIKMKKELGSALELKNIDDATKIFNYFGIKTKIENKKLIIDTYRQPDSDKNITFDDIGIDENKLFKHVTKIEKDADFNHSQLTTLNGLQSIGGDALFQLSQIKNLGELRSIGGDADFSFSKIIDLGKLRHIGGTANFEISEITNLGELENIDGSAKFSFSQLTDLGKLQRIGGSADFSNSKITCLGELESIRGSAKFTASKIKDLGKLEHIGGHVNFEYSEITSLNKLQKIGGNANFKNSTITNLGELKSIYGDTDFKNSQVTNLNQLQYIGCNADFSQSNITGLGVLQHIGGNADFNNSQITNLGKLEIIEGNAIFGDSQITNLGELRSIGGNADFRFSKIIDLGKLRHIGGKALVGNSQITDLNQLEYIGGMASFE